MFFVLTVVSVSCIVRVRCVLSVCLCPFCRVQKENKKQLQKKIFITWLVVFYALLLCFGGWLLLSGASVYELPLIRNLFLHPHFTHHINHNGQEDCIQEQRQRHYQLHPLRNHCSREACRQHQHRHLCHRLWSRCHLPSQPWRYVGSLNQTAPANQPPTTNPTIANRSKEQSLRGRA